MLWTWLGSLALYRLATGRLLLTWLWLPVFNHTGWAPRLVRIRAIGELLIVAALGLDLLDEVSGDISTTTMLHRGPPPRSS
jgi:hypothetical protein